jgi:hypothetical protein
MLFGLFVHRRHVQCISFGYKKVEIDVKRVMVDFGRVYLGWRWQ